MSGELDDEPLEYLDLGGKELKKIPVAASNHYSVTRLSLNHNELQRLDNIETYGNLLKLTATHNSIARMYSLSRMYSLRQLDLSYNGITAIEGLRELVHLEWLSLCGNNIKSVDHLNTNTALKHLDLSSNCIATVMDLKNLRNLKVLFLHDNQLSDLRFCDRYLPKDALTTLTLHGNRVADLCQAYYFKNLGALKKLTFSPNPCLEAPVSGDLTFDYRPYILNWCMSLKSLDGEAVGEHELLKAEWLYSQGKGRQFPPGHEKHKELVDYLTGCCPMASENDVGDEDQRLERVLMKAREHQTRADPSVGNDAGKASRVASSSKNRPSSAEYDADDATRTRRRKREQQPAHASRSVSVVGSGPYSAPSPCPTSSTAASISSVPTQSTNPGAKNKVTRPSSHHHSRSSSMTMSPSSPRTTKENGLKPRNTAQSSGYGKASSAANKTGKTAYDLPLNPAIYPDVSSAQRNRGMWHVDLMAQSFDPDVIRDFLSPDLDDDGLREGSMSPPDLSVSRISGPVDVSMIDDVMTRSWDPSLKMMVGAKAGRTSGVPRPVSGRSSIPSAVRKVAPKQAVSPKTPTGTPGSRKAPQSSSSSNTLGRRSGASGSSAGQQRPKNLHQRSLTEDALTIISRTRSDSVGSNASAKSNRTVTLASSSAAANHDQSDLSVHYDTNDPALNKAATSFQKIWRGYVTRNLDPVVKEKLVELRTTRTEDHIRHLTKKLEQASTALIAEQKLTVYLRERIQAIHDAVTDNKKGKADAAASPTPSAEEGSKQERSGCHCADLIVQVQQLQATVAEMSESMKLLAAQQQCGSNSRPNQQPLANGTPAESEKKDEGDAGEPQPAADLSQVSNDAILRTIASAELESRIPLGRRPSDLPSIRRYSTNDLKRKSTRNSSLRPEKVDTFASSLAETLCSLGKRSAVAKNVLQMEHLFSKKCEK